MRLAGALLLAAALTACGGQSQADCPPAGASPAASPNANADPNLAASIPDAVAGQPVQLGTFCVTELGPLGGIETSSEMLDQLGVGLEDVTLAATSASIGTPGGTIYIDGGANIIV